MSGYRHDEVVPYSASGLGKKEQVARMFDDISGRYDFINRFLSGGIDLWWRRVAIRQLLPVRPNRVLDVATGTGDMAILACRRLGAGQVTGIDISEGMLGLGRKKVARLGLEGSIDLRAGDSEHIPFGENAFDAVTVAYGVRNFENLEAGLSEILRVLRPGGRVVILEFSRPRGWIGRVYHWYLSRVAPTLARWLCRNKEAYVYLNRSIRAFPEGREFVDILAGTGFRDVTRRPLTFGITSVYTGNKKPAAGV